MLVKLAFCFSWYLWIRKVKISHIRTLRFTTPKYAEAYVRVYYDKIEQNLDINLSQTQIIQGMGRRKRLTTTDDELHIIRNLIDMADDNDIPEHYLITSDINGDFAIQELEYRLIRYIDDDKHEQNFDVRFSFDDSEPSKIIIDDKCSFVRTANRKLSLDELAFVRMGLKRVLANTTKNEPLLFNIAGDQYTVDRKARDLEYASKENRKKYAAELIRSRQLTQQESNELHATFNDHDSLALVANIYDAANRFVNTRPDHTAKVTPILHRSFSVRGENYRMILTSASVENENNEIVRKFAGRTESKVESALRRLFSKKGGVVYGSLLGLDFSLTEVEKELKSFGLRLNVANIRESIEILHKSSVSVENVSKVKIDSIFDGASSTYLPNLMWGAFGDRHFVTFHAALMSSVDQLEFRAWNPFSENKMISKSPNTEAILKSLYLNWTNASESNSYTPKMSTLLMLAGIHSGDFRSDRQKTIRALNQLMEISIIKDWEISETIKTNGKKSDLKLRLFATSGFVKDLRKISRIKNDTVYRVAGEIYDQE